MRGSQSYRLWFSAVDGVEDVCGFKVVDKACDVGWGKGVCNETYGVMVGVFVEGVADEIGVHVGEREIG